MSLYYNTLYAWKCKGTHHKLAMEALMLLSAENAESWRNLFLKHIEAYLNGSKDPDRKFRDFRNHVLHVEQNGWGGAISATQEWYAKTRQHFADRQWKRGVYAAGVMSHYLTDIFCPLHTDQSETETIIHRACEWSVSCSYDELADMLEEDLGGFPEIRLTDNENWLETLILQEATHAHELYDEVVDNYMFEAGANDPPQGLDEELAQQFAQQLGRAAKALSLVLNRCLAESQQEPPRVFLAWQTVLARLAVPMFWATLKVSNRAEHRAVKRIFREWQETGKVEKYLPEENRAILQLLGKLPDDSSEATRQTKPRIKVGAAQEKEVGYSDNDATENNADEPAGDPFATEAEAEQTEPSTSTGLSPASPLVDAPSIGPKTASRFRKIGVNTVREFLESEPETIVEKLDTRWINLELIISWQQQSQLMCCVPELRAHDVQLLTGVGVESFQDLCESSVDDLYALVAEYAASPEGQRVLRSGKIPDRDEVALWIEHAQWSEHDQAA